MIGVVVVIVVTTKAPPSVSPTTAPTSTPNKILCKPCQTMLSSQPSLKAKAWSHRGVVSAGSSVAENSAEAMVEALQQGFSGVETDLFWDVPSQKLAARGVTSS
jgi:hypothetical protein